MAQRKYAFKYREFYDVPRVMLIRTNSFVLKMESLFDEEKDNYPNFYTVAITTDPIDDLTPYWMSDGDKKWSTIGDIPVTDIKFDRTIRSNFISPKLDDMIKSSGFG